MRRTHGRTCDGIPLCVKIVFLFTQRVRYGQFILQKSWAVHKANKRFIFNVFLEVSFKMCKNIKNHTFYNICKSHDHQHFNISEAVMVKGLNQSLGNVSLFTWSGNKTRCYIDF